MKFTTSFLDWSFFIMNIQVHLIGKSKIRIKILWCNYIKYH